MSRWDSLSESDKDNLIALFIKNGISDTTRMRSIYDSGGVKPEKKDDSPKHGEYARAKDVLDIVNSSNANFVSRLKDPYRAHIQDWEDSSSIATHKLGYAEVDGKTVIFPLVQEINGKLYDFTDPKYGFDKSSRMVALDSALYAGDFVEVPTEEDAEWFTNNNYKEYYPGFDYGVATPQTAVTQPNYYDDGGFKREFAGRHNVSFIEDAPPPPKPIKIENSPHAGLKYDELSPSLRVVANKVAKAAGVAQDKIQEYYDSGRLVPMVEALSSIHKAGQYVDPETHVPLVYYFGIKKPNTSKTSVRRSPTLKYNSDVLEEADNRFIYKHRGSSFPNIDYAIPFDESTGVVNLGNGTIVPYNALDSLAKYGVEAGLPPEEYLGLPDRETRFGRNVGSANMNIAEKDSKYFNSFYNENYFKNYGVIPAESLVNDWAYNQKDKNGVSPHDRTNEPPLRHAFRYYKAGRYNPNEPNHRDLVIERGTKLLQNPDVLKWLAQSKYVKHENAEDNKSNSYENGGGV